MSVTRIVGIILIVLGALVVLGSALADFLLGGIPGFGLRQIGGVVLGAINVVLGLVLVLQKKSN
jgi:hypothetical protein